MGLGTAGSGGLVGTPGTAVSFLSVCPEVSGATFEALGGTCEAPDPPAGDGGSGVPEAAACQKFSASAAMGGGRALGKWPCPAGSAAGCEGAGSGAGGTAACWPSWLAPAAAAVAQKLAPNVWATSLLMVTLGTKATSGALAPDCVALPLACIKSK